jgi:aminopeptidase-like protein
VVDFHSCNLHVVSYSVPVRQTMSLSELRSHLHTLPEHPDWIPYRTSYYKENWGFCLSERHLQSLEEGTYEVVIDASLQPGSLTYGEYLITGCTTDEVLVFSHVCHPSLCNDNLSGVALSTLTSLTSSMGSLCRLWVMVVSYTTRKADAATPKSTAS